MAYVGIYRALYDYQPQSSEELEIRDGDLLFVLDKSSPVVAPEERDCDEVPA